jgi:glycosyltransferase involved in cell wall biosynthesis
MQNSQVAISLIICSRNRCSQLARCLDSVQLIAFDLSWELIIVDNGSTDETARLVNTFLKTARVPTTYVFEPRRGLGNAHNAGVRISRAEILAFTDDDCYPASDFLTKIWAAFQNPTVGYISGRVTLHDPTDFPFTINGWPSQFGIPKDRYLPGGLVQGANMAFRRRALLDIGGFDPLFGPGAAFNAEDVDAASRANSMGWSGQYHPEVIVSHHHRRKESDVPYMRKSYAIGIGAYTMKLLVRGEFKQFARGVYELRYRYKEEGRAIILWESIGAARYAMLFLIMKCSKALLSVLMATRNIP